MIRENNYGKASLRLWICVALLCTRATCLRNLKMDASENPPRLPIRHLQQGDDDLLDDSEESKFLATGGLGQSVDQENEFFNPEESGAEQGTVYTDDYETEEESPLQQAENKDDTNASEEYQWLEQELKEEAEAGSATKISEASESAQEGIKEALAANSSSIGKSASPVNSTIKTEGALSLPDDDEDLQRALNAHQSGWASVSSQANASYTINSKNNYPEVAEASLGGEDEFETLLEQKKPLSEEDLDATLAQEKAIDEAMLEGDDGVIAEFGDIDQKSEYASMGLESQGKGSSDTLKENHMKTSNVSTTALSQTEGSRNASIMAQGAIIGTTISDMVKDNSTSIAGVFGILVAGIAGGGIAFLGISLYRHLRNRSPNDKSLPRIIEIGALSGRRPKSPSYLRVNDRNQDSQGSSGTRWQEDDSSWEHSNANLEINANGSAVKHKKAWDWDADW